MLLPSKAEIRRWDRVLARDGLPSDHALQFHGIRGGRDELDGTNRHGAHVAILPADEAATVVSACDARFWSVVAQRAQRLPRNFRGRRLILSIAQSGNLFGSAKRNGTSHWSARSLWRRFVRACGLPDPDRWCGRPHRSKRPARDPRAVPATPPVRSLSKREIARLNYEPPCRLT